MKRRTVVLIGAGSVVFTTGLIADFIADGDAWEVRLVDIDPGNLDVAFRLATRMVERASARIKLRRFIERVEALPGADAVITVLDVGGRRAWSADVQIQRKYGIYVPVADTTTPGGFARSLRTIPTLVEIAHDMERLCPKAILLNYCNPMAAIVRAITRESGIEVYGLCHGVPGATRYLAQFLDVPVDECEGTAVGFNHFLWFLEFKHRGRDACPLIAAKNRELIAAGQTAR